MPPTIIGTTEIPVVLNLNPERGSTLTKGVILGPSDFLMLLDDESRDSVRAWLEAYLHSPEENSAEVIRFTETLLTPPEGQIAVALIRPFYPESLVYLTMDRETLPDLAAGQREWTFEWDENGNTVIRPWTLEDQERADEELRGLEEKFLESGGH
ncbi:MAG: hypothetical protein WC777_02470 [Candidatus Gracilibacteria bacterium]|jgi:hypothetical protein